MKKMKADFVKILNGDVSHVNNVDIHEDSEPNIQLIVLPKHVKNMLLLYLANNISAEKLSNWSSFVLIRDEYICENCDSDESVDFYEDMFYVLQKLSTPFIDGEITPDTVREYLSELDKYFTNDEKY